MVNLNVSTKALNIKWGLIFYAIAIILYVIRIDKKKKKRFVCSPADKAEATITPSLPEETKIMQFTNWNHILDKQIKLCPQNSS